MVNSETTSDMIVGPEDREIASKLFKVRTRMEIQRSELAQKSGISEQVIAGYENGIETIPVSDLFMLAGVMGISIDYFYNQDSTNISDYTSMEELALPN